MTDAPLTPTEMRDFELSVHDMLERYVVMKAMIIDIASTPPRDQMPAIGPSQADFDALNEMVLAERAKADLASSLLAAADDLAAERAAEIEDLERRVAALAHDIVVLNAACSEQTDLAAAEASSLRAEIEQLHGRLADWHVSDAIQPSPALAAILAERDRQISKGWTPEHDDTHTNGEIARAASCYALHAGGAAEVSMVVAIQRHYPWDRASWSPKSREESLVRAGALVLAELERVLRAKDQIAPAEAQIESAA